MAQKPLTKNQAKVAFLAQANHFTRLGTPSKIDTELLLNSLSALLAIHGQKVGFKFEGDAVGSFEPTPELTVAFEKYMPQMRNLVDVSAQPVTVESNLIPRPVAQPVAQPVTVNWSKAPEGATHWHEGEFLRWTGKQDMALWNLDAWDDDCRWTESAYGWHGTLETFLADGAIPRPVTKPTRPEPIEALSLSVRAQHLLLSAGILTIPDLATKTESELLRIKGLGKKSLAEIVEALKRHVGGQTA